MKTPSFVNGRDVIFVTEDEAPNRWQAEGVVWAHCESLGYAPQFVHSGPLNENGKYPVYVDVIKTIGGEK